MTNILQIAKETLLFPFELNDLILEKTLNNILTNQVDYSDLYFQNIINESWTLEDRIIKEGGFSLDRGVGIRAISDEKVGFSYTSDLNVSSINEASNAAKNIAVFGGKNNVKISAKENIIHNFYGIDNPLKSILDVEKINLLKRADEIARKADPRVKEVIASISASHSIVFIVATDGTYKADIRPLVRFNVTVLVEENGKTEKATVGVGGRYGYKEFIENDFAKLYAKEAIRQAIVLLDAKPAPAGLMPVVLGAGWPGVLLHEAIGHGLEGDANRKGSSAFSNKIGEKVASSVCTIVDDGTLKNRRGSLNIDDEGTLTQKTVLIENGILKGYMQDKLNAKLMGTKSTGNGRRESYSHLTIPRMTNTYMLAGKNKPEEIIAKVDKGLYAVNFAGGQVDVTSGKFVFNASEAYLIENGKITAPVKGAMIVGNGPDILTKVSMVGDDLKLDDGVGTCGKSGQWVPVGVGQPTLLIDEITVGGTD